MLQLSQSLVPYCLHLLGISVSRLPFSVSNQLFHLKLPFFQVSLVCIPLCLEVLLLSVDKRLAFLLDPAYFALNGLLEVAHPELQFLILLQLLLVHCLVLIPLRGRV